MGVLYFEFSVLRDRVAYQSRCQHVGQSVWNSRTGTVSRCSCLSTDYEINLDGKIKIEKKKILLNFESTKKKKKNYKSKLNLTNRNDKKNVRTIYIIILIILNTLQVRQFIIIILILCMKNKNKYWFRISLIFKRSDLIINILYALHNM